jgi:hypothetical protein
VVWRQLILLHLSKCCATIVFVDAGH